MGFLSDNFISRFFIVVIRLFYSWTGSYLVAVVLFTIAMKLVLLPLDIRSKKTQRKQQKLGPKMQAIRERYGHDDRLMNMKLQELYQKEDLKMLSGCLPMLIQLPIIFAMFGAIRALANVEMVQMVVGMSSDATMLPPSFLWVKNIWQPDTGTATIMPSLSEFATLLPQVQGKLDAESILTAQQLIGNVSVVDLHTMYQALPDGSFFTSLYQPAFSAITPGVLEQAQAFNYNAVIAPTLQHFDGAVNGYFIMPIVAGLSSYVSTKMMTKQQAQMQSGSAGSSMMMELMMPLMMGWFSSTTAMAFAVYYIINNLWTIAQNYLMDSIFKKEEAREEEEKYGL